jgi:hypothetical protein
MKKCLTSVAIKNANENYIKISPQSSEKGYRQEYKKQQMFMRLQEKHLHTVGGKVN